LSDGTFAHLHGVYRINLSTLCRIRHCISSPGVTVRVDLRQLPVRQGLTAEGPGSSRGADQRRKQSQHNESHRLILSSFPKQQPADATFDTFTDARRKVRRHGATNKFGALKIQATSRSKAT
jgi:hypothetical protein